MRLIDGEELKTAFPPGETVRTECVRATIDHMPTIEPRPRGKWEKVEVMPVRGTGIEEVQAMRCGECKRWLTTPYAYYLTKYNFCPHCGADMRLSKLRADMRQREEEQDD